MDFALSEEQEMLRKMARDFLENECPKSLVREMEEDEKGYSPELWKKMADLGWMGLVLPAEYGGEGMAFLDLAILIEEMGRALVPAPYLSTVVYCGMPILAAGTEEQKKEYLPKIAKGELILSLALTEPSASWEPSGVETKAVADGDDFVINGTKLFISDAHIADYLLCVTRTKEGAAGEDDITLFLVDAKSKGINLTALKTIADDKQFEVVFDNVRVPKSNMLGELNGGWAVIKDMLPQATLAQCALMVGGAQQVLEMTVNYAKERVQFGKPIGSFQAIQHKCANMATDVDGCRFVTYEAAWKLSEGLPCSLEVSMAKAWVSEAYRRTCAEGHQIHGGIGFIKDHDMQLYYRRAKSSELIFGDADYHRELVAQQIGL
ncbi:MAG: acyl-CoA/acyl-ACP dehydrogenase [Dehalococcoidia bacterium]|nr:MAG: acyl-CoA/acyl-ACP dehydrogenase [Dehalococcoidia bacterium]